MRVVTFCLPLNFDERRYVENLLPNIFFQLLSFLLYNVTRSRVELLDEVSNNTKRDEKEKKRKKKEKKEIKLIARK